MVSTSGSRLPRRSLLGAVAGASSSTMARKVAGIMARRARADIGRLAGRSAGTPKLLVTSALRGWFRPSQTVWQ